MIYRLIEATNVIANVQDSFNIDDSDWIGRAGNWINKCLSDLGVISELTVIHYKTQAVDYKVELPCSIKALEAIEVNGTRISASNSVTSHSNYGMERLDIRYTLLGDNYIEFQTDDIMFKDCDVIVHYKSLPVKLNKQLGLMLPMIPDIDVVQDAIATYIMIKILTRGYKHPVLNLISNSEVTNPYFLYYGLGRKNLRKKARLAIKRMTKDEYRQASAMTRSMQQPERYETSDFNRKF